MADYELAVQHTELWEGGYSFNHSDSGGETYRGISRNNFPNWQGWPIIDAAKNQPGIFISDSLNANAALQSLVVEFYRTNFWQFTGINDQAVANKIFDLCVNVGTRHAISIAQLAVGVPVDGLYGRQTEASINSTNSKSLLSAIDVRAEQYYQAIVASHPQDAIFLRGWLNRVYS